MKWSWLAATVLSIVVPTAQAACALPPASPSAPPAGTATPVPAATLTATHAAPSSMPRPSATPGYFLPPAFSVSEVPGAADSLSLDIDPRFEPPPPGEYLLFPRVTVPRDEAGRWGGELHYSSLDGRTQARILSFRGHFSLIGAAPASGRLHLADFAGDGITIWTIDWGQGNTRELRLEGNAGLSEDQLGWVVSPDSSSAFSPDGRWLVWDCEPEGQYAWCLLDLEEEAGYTIVPGGALRNAQGARYPGYFRWAPNGEWFLARCSELDRNGRPSQCAVFPGTEQVQWWSLTKDYVLRNNSISPQGIDLFLFIFPDIQAFDEPVQLAVVEGGCFLEKTCFPRGLVSFPQREPLAAWSPSGEQIALDLMSPLATQSDQMREIRLVNVADGSFHVITQKLRGGLLGWLPDGKSMLIECGGIPSKYRLCALSTHGVSRLVASALGHRAMPCRAHPLDHFGTARRKLGPNYFAFHGFWVEPSASPT